MNFKYTIEPEGKLHLSDSLLYGMLPSPPYTLIVLSICMSLFLCLMVGSPVMGL